MTYRDIRDVKHFKNRTVIAIKAPPETRLEVPDPKEVTTGFFSLYITLFYKCAAVHVNCIFYQCCELEIWCYVSQSDTYSVAQNFQGIEISMLNTHTKDKTDTSLNRQAYASTLTCLCVIRKYKQASFILYCGMVNVYFNGISMVLYL